MNWTNPSLLSLLILLIFYSVMVWSAIIVVLSENRNPIRSIAWVVALICLPVIGLVFYFFFGRGLKGMRLVSRRKKRKWMLKHQVSPKEMAQLQIPSGHKSLIRLAMNLNAAPFTLNNEITTFTEGVAKFEALKRDLKNASKSILVQYYIFSDDELGREIADILKAKAREGLTVMVLYDHVGSFSTKNRFFKEMKDAEVDVHPFFRVTFPQLANRINWRNHRKVVVIDREIGYIGGMNIATKYIEGLDAKTRWRDTHFRLRGEIVESLFYSFATDWSFMGKEFIPIKKQPVAVGPNNVGIQLVTSGPTDRWSNLSLCFLKAISTAKKRIWIQTPYFLPPEEIQAAMEAASMARIDVRIMIPRTSDSLLLKWASFSYVTRCLAAGMKVYLYDPGMIHSKVIIVDDDLVTAGSTNLDFRSLENNFECNLFVYEETFCRQMADIFTKDMGKCTRLSLLTWSQRPLWQRTLESLVRLVAPIL